MNQYIDIYMDVLKTKYAVFTGRAGRMEFWVFVLCNLVANVVLGVVDAVLGIGILSLIYSLAVLVPSIAVGIRRLHDIGQTGWLMLIALVPVLGAIVLLVLCAMQGQADQNQYGPNPQKA